ELWGLQSKAPGGAKFAHAWVIRNLLALSPGTWATPWFGNLVSQRFDPHLPISPPAPPQVLIHPVTRQGPPSARVLSCVAWGFFPPEVDIAWFWNGAPVEAQQGPLSLRSNGDWTFQAERSLALEPRPRGIYSCRVNHPSLQEPIVVEWGDHNHGLLHHNM
uniref:Ig-like domain-containing protein n=1 Tax=Anolis carolinensis TaxID=28377 RepID=H9GEK1_ANOCA